MQLHFLLMGAPVGIKNEASFFIYGDACWNQEGMQIRKNSASYFQQKAPVGIENEASFFYLWDAFRNQKGMQIHKNPASFFQQKAPVGIENEASFVTYGGLLESRRKVDS